jgi:hypothetical protein
MRRTLLITTLAVFACAFGAVASAEDYEDQETKFRVTVPDGWEKHPKLADKIALVLISPRFKTSDGMCIMMGEAVSGTETSSQGDINERMSGFDEAFWRSVAEDKNTKDIKVEATTEMRNGRNAAVATIRYVSTLNGTESAMVERYVLYVVPGRILMGQCGSLAAAESVEEADMKIVLTSFEPTSAGLISKLTPRQNEARLTLHAGPTFDGATRALTGDTPDLARAGWNVAAGSFSVRGYGLWEVCDGVNYQGNCLVVAGASSAAFGDRALRIGSARRVTAPGDPRNAIGLAAELAGAARAEQAKLHRH